MNREEIRRNFQKCLEFFDFDYVSRISKTKEFKEKYGEGSLLIPSKEKQELLHETSKALDDLFDAEDSVGRPLMIYTYWCMQLEYDENNNVYLRFVPESWTQSAKDSEKDDE